MRILLCALVLTLGGTAGASAGSLQPSHSQSVVLGGVRGNAYYTVEDDGEYRVVVTVAADETASPIRFVALLAPNQKVTLAVPGAAGGQGALLEILRQGDDVVVTPPHLATD